MITNIINKLSLITFFFGLSLGDSESFIIPVIVLLSSAILYKITEKDL